MEKKSLLLSLLAFAVQSLCLLSCNGEPSSTLSNVSIEETIEDVDAEEARFVDFAIL